MTCLRKMFNWAIERGILEVSPVDREIDLPGKVWNLPASRSKNGTAHAIPLSDKAVEILESLPRFDAKERFIFTHDGRSTMGGFARVKDHIDAAITKARGEAISHWTLHDLRRSVASGMAGIGIGPHVIEAVLGHRGGIVSGVALVYNRHTYAAEQRQALEAWARWLEAIVSGSEGTS